MIGGVLFPLFLVIGTEIYKSQTFILSIPNLLICILRVLLLVPFSSSALLLCFRYLSTRTIKLDAPLRRPSSFPLFLLAWVIILLSWLPAFLAYYPGIFGYDMHNETHQAFTGVYNTFQPLIYTLFFQGSYALGMRIFHSPTCAVALFFLLQMLLLSAMYAAVSVMLVRIFLLPRYFFWITVFFYAVIPNHAILSISSTKDAFFGGAFVLLTAQLHALCKNPESIMRSISRIVALFLSVILCSLLRNNLIYALFILIPFSLFLRKKRGEVLLLLCISLLLALFARTGLAKVLHADGGQRVELLSVPIQQVSRVYSLHNEELDEQEKAAITEYLPEEALENYWPLLSDPVKDHCKIGDGMPSITGFLKVWAGFLPRYFQEYCDQFLIMTLGYWYPEETWHDIVYSCYNEPDTEESLGYLYTGFMENIINGVERHSLSPFFYRYYQWYAHDNGFESIPIISLLLSPGFSCWVMLFFLCYGISLRRMKYILPVLLSFLMWLTLLLGPCLIVRYVYPFLSCWPVWIGSFLSGCVRKGYVSKAD